MGGFLPMIPDELLLSWVVLFPFGAALALFAFDGIARMFALPRLGEQTWRFLGFLAALGSFALTVEVWLRFDSTLGGMQFVQHTAWLADYGINYYLGVDGISLFLVVLTGFLLPIIFLASWTDIGVRIKHYIFFMLALQTGMLGAFLALNMFLFYVFWEVMLIPMYFVIGIWGGPRRIYATSHSPSHRICIDVKCLSRIIYPQRRNNGNDLGFM